MSDDNLLNETLALRVRLLLSALFRKSGNDRAICLSDVAQALAEELGFCWPDVMRLVRTVVAEMVDMREVEAIQDGWSVDIREARGPVCVRLGKIRCKPLSDAAETEVPTSTLKRGRASTVR